MKTPVSRRHLLAASTAVVPASILLRGNNALAFSETSPFTVPGTSSARSLDARFADLVNAKDFGASPGASAATNTTAIQAAIDYAYTNKYQGVWLPAGNYSYNPPLFLDAPGNLRSNLANPTIFGFSLALVGEEGLGNDNQYGTILSASAENTCALYIGPGQGMRVSGISVVNGSGSNNYRAQLNSSGIGIGITGGSGGSSRVLLDNVTVERFYTGIETGANGNNSLGDSNTFVKCWVEQCYCAYSIAGTQNFINGFYQCNASSCTIGLQDFLGCGAVVSGGNWSATSSASASFGISSISALTATPQDNDFDYSFTATIASPDAFLAAGVYTAFTIVTAHFGVIPMVMTAYNAGTHVASFKILSAWSYYFFPQNNALTTSDLQTEVQAATKVYAVELITSFYGSGFSIQGIHIENPNAATTLIHTFEGIQQGRVVSIDNAYFNYDPSVSYYAPQNSPTDAQLAIYYAQSQFPLIWNQSGPLSFTNCDFQAVTDPVVIDVSPESALATLLSGINFNKFQGGINMRSGELGGFISGGVYQNNGNSENLGCGWWDKSPFISVNGRNQGGGDAWRYYGWGVSPQWGFRPAPWTIPTITPAQLATLQGSLPAITGTSGNYVVGYPLVWGSQAYQVNDWSITTSHPVIQTTIAGASGANNTVLASAQVGDIVQSVINLTTPGDVAADFEKIITVAGHIQQTSANLTGATLLVTVKTPKLFVSSHKFYTYGQNLTTSNVPSLSWSYKGKSFVVNVNDQTLLFPGLGIILNDGSSDVDYIITGCYPSLGYITVASGDDPGTGRLSGTKTSVITGTIIKQQSLALTYL